MYVVMRRLKRAAGNVSAKYLLLQAIETESSLSTAWQNVAT